EGGHLLVKTALATLAQPLPVGFERLPSNEKRNVPLSYRLLGEDAFGFVPSARDSSLPLTIDPELTWSTYLGATTNPGGVGDIAYGVDIMDNGDVFVAGKTGGPDFPTTPGAYSHPGGGQYPIDVFVARFRSDGTLLYSSVFGGSQYQEQAQALRADMQGRVTVAGWTNSIDFPTT